ncbi:MAG TPA: 3-hydroxyacyl-CoA dehydrogenase NAD-binding domain-containing protein, partial [Puia sp.]|nr:3-hydroxyacyl-CoA dehydrogenase NAD-binding domain-containing protein [Puia sp.]
MSKKQPIGTVGLGLMGSSIATCVLAAGHPVTSLVRTMGQAEEARQRILGYLEELKKEGMLQENPLMVLERHTITDDVGLLKGHEVVIESIIESVSEKKAVYAKLESVLSPTAVIGSNTSAIPVSILQEGLQFPERMLGIHWAE